MSEFLTKSKLLMKRKRGVIPQSIWNKLVDVVYSFRITSVVGGSLERNTTGTTLVINPPPSAAGGGAIPCTALLPSMAANVLSISPGFVQPDDPLFNAIALSTIPAPTLTITAAGALYLLVDWTPVAAGAAPAFTMASCSSGNSRFVVQATPPAEVLAAVNPATGALTVGTQVESWASIISDGAGGWMLAANPECGACQPGYCANNAGVGGTAIGVSSYYLRFN